MKSEKMLHFCEVAVLILIMACVVWGIQIANKDYSTQDVPIDTSEPVLSQSEPQTEAVTENDDAVAAADPI